MLGDLLAETGTKMSDAIEALKHDLAGIRTGRASPALVERLQVPYYGTSTPLNQLATISTPEARLLVIQPWDKNAMSDIEKAILASDLGLNPNNDGSLIRLNIPPLTEERRRDLVKMARRRVEEAKVEVRNLRRDAVSDVRQFEQEKLFSQDEAKRGQDDLQDLTTSYIAQVDLAGGAKEKEIMET